MTETITTPAQRRYDGAELEQIETCEYNTDPFTERELDQIDGYNARIAGIPDSLDPPAARAIPEGWAVFQVVGHYRAMLELLKQWHDEIDRLRGELMLSDDKLSKAAVNFIAWELMHWQAAREAQLSALASYIFGESEHGMSWPLPILDCVAVRHRDGAFNAEMNLLGIVF